MFVLYGSDVVFLYGVLLGILCILCICAFVHLQLEPLAPSFVTDGATLSSFRSFIFPGRVGGCLQEDCLLLNIYSPKNESLDSPETLTPVMVWLHGGSLLHGSNKFSEQGPQHFLDR